MNNQQCVSRWVETDRFDTFDEELDLEQVQLLRQRRQLQAKKKPTMKFLLQQEAEALLQGSRKTLYVEGPGDYKVRIFWSPQRQELQVLPNDGPMNDGVRQRIIRYIRDGRCWVSAV